MKQKNWNMSYQGKTLDDLANIVDKKLCPFSNELLMGCFIKTYNSNWIVFKNEKTTEETNSKTLCRRHFG